MNARSKITSKGQTTVPAEVREALGLKPGDQVDYVIEDGTVKLRKVPSALDLAGILYDPNRKPLTIDDMNKAVEEAILERYERSFDRD